MKNWSKLMLTTLLILAMVLSFAACGNQTGDDNTSATDVTPTPEVTLDTETPVNIMVLNGTTGFGMAKLISDNSKGDSTLNYNISVETDASNITAALINKTVDIAALPTNAAAVAYNKSQGEVQALALNTLGVLYLVTDDTISIASFEDLRGQTVYVPAQNPTIIFSYLCKANGLEVGTDVFIDNTYAQPADLRTAVASGEVSVAVLPEPMLTIAKSSNDKLVTAMDLTVEWNKVSPEGSLVQGCVVVRKEFAEEHPNEVAAFLEEYGRSIEFLSGDPSTVGAVIEETGVFAKGAVAAKALPNCNICFITGEEMKTAMETFLAAMPVNSVGGALPAADFYYGA